jgi:hypothetical protein
MRIFGPLILAALTIPGARAIPVATAQSAPATQPSAQPVAPTPQVTPPAAGAVEPPQVTNIILENYGQYSAIAKASQKPAAEGIPFDAVTNVHAKKRTRSILIGKGVNFGFEYEAVGSPRGEKATLHFVVIYPPPGLNKPGSSSPIPRDEYDRKVRIGVKGSYDGYELDNDWEMVPGDWTLEIWSGSNRLASETFTLVR